jgi:hypothetical protein
MGETMGLRQPSPEDSSGFIIGGAICLGMALPLTYLSDTLLGFLWSSSGDHRSDFDMLFGLLSAAVGVLLLVRGIAGPPADPGTPEGLARSRKVVFLLFGVPAIVGAAGASLCWLVPLAFSHYEVLKIRVINAPEGDPGNKQSTTSWVLIEGHFRRTLGGERAIDQSQSLREMEDRSLYEEFRMEYPPFALGRWNGEWTSILVELNGYLPASKKFKLHLERCENCRNEPVTVNVKTAHPCGPTQECLDEKRHLSSNGIICDPEPNCFAQEVRLAKHADLVSVTLDFKDFPAPKPLVPR